MPQEPRSWSSATASVVSRPLSPSSARATATWDMCSRRRGSRRSLPFSIGWRTSDWWCSMSSRPSVPPTTNPPRPVGLLAELTYRCPLHCPYCSNPVDLAAYRDELTTSEWRRVLDEARELGVLQVHLSGGEPLARRDLTDLVAHAHRLGMYTSLVTSGVPLTETRFAGLAAAGLDHVQLSVQDESAATADAIAGVRAHDRKLAAAAMVTGHGLPLTLNVVLHRDNIGHVAALTKLAERMGADRLELANTQYYGWALRNWSALL